jgi:hypothetical protein
MELFTLIHKKNKYGQAWGVDLMVAMIIFSVGIIVFLIYSVNYSRDMKENYEVLAYEGKIVSDSILSEGYPVEWNSENVVRIGILSENKIDQNKLDEFYNLAQMNYTLTKRLLNTRHNYYFLVEGNITVNSEEVEGFGEPGINSNNISAKNLVRISRATIYKNKPVTIYVYIWG